MQDGGSVFSLVLTVGVRFKPPPTRDALLKMLL